MASGSEHGNAAVKSAPQRQQAQHKAFTADDLQTTLDYVNVAETKKALHNLYNQAQQAGANESQLAAIESACLKRESHIGAK